jgi:hypothetical protein
MRGIGTRTFKATVKMTQEDALEFMAMETGRIFQLEFVAWSFGTVELHFVPGNGMAEIMGGQPANPNLE